MSSAAPAGVRADGVLSDSSRPVARRVARSLAAAAPGGQGGAPDQPRGRDGPGTTRPRVEPGAACRRSSRWAVHGPRLASDAVSGDDVVLVGNADGDGAAALAGRPGEHPGCLPE